MAKNKAAQALGRLARGVPKNYSKAELKRRAERVKAGHDAWLKAIKIKRDKAAAAE